MRAALRAFWNWVGVSAVLVGVTCQAIASVPGWPADRVAQGAIKVGGPEVPLLQRRPVDSLFTYAGILGNGDPGVIITHDKKIHEIFRIIRGIEKNNNTKIMLTVVFYNVNASDDPAVMLRDLSNDAPGRYLEKHIINYVSLLRQLESYKESQRPVPATLVLSPDFLGELHKDCQPRRCKVAWETLVPLREALSNAFDYLKLDKSDIPAEFLGERTEIKHYLKAINWMSRKFAPSVPFGWQTNVWAGDPRGHGWLHLAAEKSPGLIAERVKAEASFLRKLWVMGHADEKFEPHFLAFDKYAADVFDPRLSGAGVNAGYLYSVKVWDTYLGLAKGISEEFSKKPIMLWQLPAGHLQVQGSIDDRRAHGSTEADYFLGNPQLAEDLSNLQPYIRDTLMPTNTPIYQSSARTVSEYLRCPPGRDGCWRNGHLAQAKASNVFAILWGGGETTSVVGLTSRLDDSGWIFERIRAQGLNNGVGSTAKVVPQDAQAQANAQTRPARSEDDGAKASSAKGKERPSRRRK